ncbi:MAG: serine/threonine protein kinase [Pelomonas sp.]|nr:serine/threonine protein kinase [Roseateles sp.]
MPDAPDTRRAAPAPADSVDALAPGARLGEYEVRAVIGAGGFGIVYRAWDPALEREVAVKEFMPVTLAGRGADARVTLRSRSSEEDFALGLRSFVNEARLLARFDHPALVKVHRFWEANATAYMAMPFYRGRTLRELRARMGVDADAPVPDEAWLRGVIDPLLGALEVLHRADVFHRDIAPDNILWCADEAGGGRPVLLDFGAARQVLADRTQTLTAILKPQFAPIEQYADTQSMRQGPWTDLYGLASTCYYLLAGRAPLPATARVLDDTLAPLARLAPAGCPARLLEALDWAMAVRPQDRPQSVAAWREVLDGRAPLPARAPSPMPAPPADAASFDKTIALTRPAPRAAATAASAPTAAAQARAGRRWPLGGLLVALLACAGGAAAWLAAVPHGASPAPASALAPVARAALVAAPPAAPPASAAPSEAAPVASPPVLASLDAAPVAAPPSAAVPARRHEQALPVKQAVAPLATPPRAVPTAVATARDPDADIVDMRADGVGRNATADAAPAASRPASAAGARRSLREVCVADGAQDIAACIQRLCAGVPRFAGYAACVRLREKQQGATPG